MIAFLHVLPYLANAKFLCYHNCMKKTSLAVYVIGVVIVITLVNFIIGYTNPSEVRSVMTFSLGFLLGMLAMYIAVHLYRWK